MQRRQSCSTIHAAKGGILFVISLGDFCTFKHCKVGHCIIIFCFVFSDMYLQPGCDGSEVWGLGTPLNNHKNPQVVVWRVPLPC